MKRKGKYLILLLLLLVVCSGLVTYAIYKTSNSGNATVNAARWNVVFKNGEEVISNNFDISLEDAEWTNPLGNVASGKIAPGSSATFYITIDATNTETDVYYEAVIGNSFNDPDFEVTVGEDSGVIEYSTTSGEMVKNIPITVIWNGNINDSDNKNSDDLLKKATNIEIPVTITAAQKLALRYTLTFNDGFGNILSTKKVMENETVGELPSNPTKVGYTFSGWYDAETGGNEVTTDTPATSGMNIYAHWTIKYVTVTFDSNGGSSVASQQIQEGSTINSIPNSNKSESELIGWFDENDNELTLSTIIMNDITYIAQWNSPSYARAGTLVYYDPVSTNTCDSNSFNLNKVKSGTSTCYKWRIIKEDLNNAILQLDHNLVGTSWNSDRNNTTGPITLLTNLANATSSWTRVPLLNYTYDTSAMVDNLNYGTLNCVNGVCTISKTGSSVNGLRARIITANEIVSLTRTQTTGNTSADSWSITNQSSFYFSETGYKIGTMTSGNGNNNLSWLVENTYTYSSSHSGSTNSIYSVTGDGIAIYGYWTLTPKDAADEVYAIFYDGRLESSWRMSTSASFLNNSGYFGARPVITVPKADLSFN